MATFRCRVTSLKIYFVVVTIDMPFNPCTDGLPYIARLMTIMARSVSLCDKTIETQIFDYVQFQRLFDRHYLLTSFHYCLKGTPFKRWLLFKQKSQVFVN